MSRRANGPRSEGESPRPLRSVDQFDAADDELADLRLEMEAAARRGQRLRARLEASEREAVLLSEHLTTRSALAGELRAQATQLRRDLDAARLERADLADRLERSREQLDRRVDELAEARSQEVRLERELAGSRARTQELEQEAGQAAVDRARQLEEYEARSSELAAARAEPARLEALLTATEATRDAYARIVRATAPTPLGRVANRWQRYSAGHPRSARVIRAPLEATWRVLTLRWPGWLRQHPLFDVDYYEEANRDVPASRLRPWWHYVRHGIREGRQPNRYFDRSWYLRTYPDVEVAGFEPLDHYYRRGCWEGRDPSPRFSTDWYLAQHPDVAAAGICPLEHFLREGAASGDAPAPPGAARAGAASRGVSRSSLPATSRSSRTAADPRARRPVSAASAVEAAPVAASSPVRADLKAVRRLLSEQLPAGARLGVISDGNDELLKIGGPTIVPVPRAADGGRASDLPRNLISAQAHIEALRATAIDYLLAPDPSLWLTAVPGLAGYLDGRYERVGRASAAFLWDVRRPREVTSSNADGLAETLGRLRDSLGAEPSVLGWDSPVDIARVAPAATTFTPPDAAAKALGYADQSVDAVVYRAGSGRDAEARRVARSVSIAVSDDGTEPIVEWRADSDDTAPSVSVVIPTFADDTMVAACLRTLEETTPHRLAAEFIVADDGSEADIVTALEAIVADHPRARLIHNEHNGGYIAAVSAGAATASNDILVFLNNDTVLLPGWLEALLDTFARQPQAGVVGGMLLYPDGRLQEAGCTIFRDGSATKIGYGDTDPSLSYYAHPREVDYVSGALLATPRSLFKELGGLDEAYGFGYYEDGDYCFKARAAGRLVLYQPLSRIVHVEGGTAGLDLTQGPKAYQARNQARFVERWGDELASQPERPDPMDLYASRDLVIRGRADRSDR